MLIHYLKQFNYVSFCYLNAKNVDLFGKLRKNFKIIRHHKYSTILKITKAHGNLSVPCGLLKKRIYMYFPYAYHDSVIRSEWSGVYYLSL